MAVPDRILEIARKLLQTAGPSGVTVAALTRAMGVTAPALYKHVKSLDEVLVALTAESWTLFNQALVGSNAQGTAAEQLLQMGERYIAFGLSDPQRYRLLFMSSDAQASQPPKKQPISRGMGALLERVEACRSEGSLPASCDAMELAIAYWASCHGLVSLYLSGGAAAQYPLDEYQKLATRSLRHLLSGARTDAVRTPATKKKSRTRT